MPEQCGGPEAGVQAFTADLSSHSGSLWCIRNASLLRRVSNASVSQQAVLVMTQNAMSRKCGTTNQSLFIGSSLYQRVLFSAASWE
jgi:hypothetical protein